MHSALKRASFSLVVAVAASLSIGCATAVDPVDSAASDENVAVATGELNAFGRQLVGNFHRADGHNFYETISLRANGKYSAVYKPCGVFQRCANRPENGRWSTVGSNKLRLNPAGAAPAKIFTVNFAGDGSGFKITANGQTERLDRDVVCDPAVFTKVVAPALASVLGVWTRVEGGLIQTRESLALRSDLTYELTKTRGPNCQPGQPCPRIATLLWETRGTFDVEPGHGVQLHPVVSNPDLAESFGVQENCEGTLRLATTESSEDVFLSKSADACVGDADCSGRDIGPNSVLCGWTAQPVKACDASSNTCQWSCNEAPAPFCGGIAAIECPAGLTCIFDGNVADAGGTCQFCPIPSCAAPPPGCHYEAGPFTPGVCPTGCGVLVCDGAGE